MRKVLLPVRISLSDLLSLDLDLIDFLQVVLLMLGNLLNEPLLESLMLTLVKIFLLCGHLGHPLLLQTCPLLDHVDKQALLFASCDRCHVAQIELSLGTFFGLAAPSTRIQVFKTSLLLSLLLQSACLPLRVVFILRVLTAEGITKVLRWQNLIVYIAAIAALLCLLVLETLKFGSLLPVLLFLSALGLNCAADAQFATFEAQVALGLQGLLHLFFTREHYVADTFS